MKLFIPAALMMALLFNKTFAQNREFSIRIGSGNVADTGKVSLTLNKNQKPLLAFNADLDRQAASLSFTVKDTLGNIKLQSLVQVVNEQLIKWQLSDRTIPERPTETKGELRLYKRVQ